MKQNEHNDEEKEHKYSQNASRKQNEIMTTQPKKNGSNQDLNEARQ